MSGLRPLVRGLIARLGLLGPVQRAAGRPPAYAHGHALLLSLLRKRRRRSGGGYLVEVGTTRERMEGQGSTIELARAAKRLGLQFVTVDMDPANTEQARADMAGMPNATAVTAKGEDYLAAFSEPVVAAYLDAFDIDHGKHSEHRKDRYRTYLGVEITNDASHVMHLACAEALVPNVVQGGLIVIDDTHQDGSAFVGKGATAVPMLLANGFQIVGMSPAAIALKKVRE